MNVHVGMQTGSIELSLFRQKYQDTEKFMAYCRECPNYGEFWSCPPLSFDADAFLAPYTWANLLCAQIHPDKETIRAANTAEKIKAAGWDIVSKAKARIERKLRAIETRMSGRSPCPPVDAVCAKLVPERKTCPAASRMKCATRWTLSASTSQPLRKNYSILRFCGARTACRNTSR